MTQNKRLLQLALGCLLCSLLVGCISTKYVEPKKYLFNIQDSFIKKSNANYACSVFVWHVVADSPFNQLDFLYRIKSGQYLEDYYHGFLAIPSEQLDSILGDYLRTHGHFNLGVASSPTIQNKLQVTLLELYADYRDRNNPQAVIALNFNLTKLENGKTVVLLDRVFRSSIALKQKNTDNLLRAWNIGLKDILMRAVKSLNTKVTCIVPTLKKHAEA